MVNVTIYGIHTDPSWERYSNRLLLISRKFAVDQWFDVDPNPSNRHAPGVRSTDRKNCIWYPKSLLKKLLILGETNGWESGVPDISGNLQNSQTYEGVLKWVAPNHQYHPLIAGFSLNKKPPFWGIPHDYGNAYMNCKLAVSSKTRRHVTQVAASTFLRSL